VIESSPLKHLASVRIVNGVGEAAEFDNPEWPRYVRTTDIASPRLLRTDTFKSLPPEIASRAPLEDGDIVMTAAGATIGKSLLYSSPKPACYAGYLVRFRPKHGVDSRFIAYWMESQHYWDQISTGKVVSTIENFSAGKYQNLRCPSPPPSAQRAIADYLDTETARIDALIEKKQRMTEVFESRTESVISTVLDPLINHWGETPLKYVSEIRFSNVDKKSHDGQSVVKLCNYTDVYYNRRITGDLDFMTATATVEQIRRFSLCAGDVLFTKDSETADDIAVPALVIADLPGVVLGYHLAMLRPTAVNGDFLYWVLRSRRCRDAFSLAASGVTRVGLRQDSVGRVPIPSASLNDQVKVVEQLENTTRVLDEVSSTLESQIALLRERRQALITTAVTGELKVPGVAA